MIPSDGIVAATGRLLGWAAVAASLVFVGVQVWSTAPWRLAATHAQTLVAAVMCGSLLYGMAGFLLSSAWYHLLGAGRTGTPPRLHHAVYGQTQIAKYLPGNVFHLVGRQMMGRRLGYNQGRLALASVLETLLLLLVAGCLSLPILIPRLDGDLLLILAVTSVVLALIAARWRSTMPLGALLDLVGRSDHSRVLVARSIAWLLLRSLLLYGSFFLAAAAVLWMVATSVTDPGHGRLGLADGLSVVAFAWLIGFVTPGSSAGIGVREAMLIAMLEGTFGPAASGLIAIALRLVSVVGDGIFFALALMIAPPGDQAQLVSVDRSAQSTSRS